MKTFIEILAETTEISKDLDIILKRMISDFADSAFQGYNIDNSEYELTTQKGIETLCIYADSKINSDGYHHNFESISIEIDYDESKFFDLPEKYVNLLNETICELEQEAEKEAHEEIEFRDSLRSVFRIRTNLNAC